MKVVYFEELGSPVKTDLIESDISYNGDYPAKPDPATVFSLLDNDGATVRPLGNSPVLEVEDTGEIEIPHKQPEVLVFMDKDGNPTTQTPPILPPGANDDDDEVEPATINKKAAVVAIISGLIVVAAIIYALYYASKQK